MNEFHKQNVERKKGDTNVYILHDLICIKFKNKTNLWFSNHDGSSQGGGGVGDRGAVFL